MIAGGFWAKCSLHCQQRLALNHRLSCNNLLPEALLALSEEPERAGTRWDHPAGVSEGSNPSHANAKEQNPPSLLLSH